MPRLKDTEVSAVALVKHPANRRKFLLRKRSGDSDALVPPSEDAVAAIRAEILRKADLSQESREVLEAIGRLAHGNPEISAADLLSVGVAAGLGAVAKGKKQEPSDEGEDDSEAEDEADAEDDEANWDEDEEGDEDKQEEGEEEAPDKKKVEKGGPGSGRYPAGSHQDEDHSASSKDIHALAASGAAAKATRQASQTFSEKDHKAAQRAHFKAFQANSRAGNTQAAAHHMRSSMDHESWAKDAKQTSALMKNKIDHKQISLFADTSAKEGEPMEANVEKSEKVDVAKAMDEMRAQLAKAQSDLEVERDHRLTKAIKEEMVSAFPNLSIDRDHLTGIVKSMRSVEDRTDHDNLMTILKAADAQVAAAKASGADVTKAVSKSTWTGNAIHSGSYKEKQDAVVNAFIAKSGKPMTYWEAHNALSANPTPEFAALAQESN